MPFSLLPHDIIRDIFMKTRAIQGPYTRIPTVVTLSQIAPFTRRIVHNEALLWTNIDDQVMENLAYLYMHLDLSRHCLLDISFQTCFHEGEDASFPLSKFMPLLAHSDRWRLLHLNSWSRRVLNATINLMKYMRPKMLEELFVTWCTQDAEPNSDSDDEDEDESDILSFFQCGTPCLKKLSLTGVRCIPSMTRDLTHLELSSTYACLWPYPDFVEIISKMVSLTDITMDGPVVRVGPRAIKNLETIALLNLQHLVLSAWADKVETVRYLAAMLVLFSSAPLKSIDFGYEYSEVAYQHIITNLTPGRIRFPQVTGIVLALEHWTERDVRRFIQALPSVERLHFRWPWHAVGILDALINAPSTEDLFPHLHAIYLGGVGDDETGLASHKVRQLAEKRIISGKPLRELWIRRELWISRESWTQTACEDFDWLQGNVQVRRVSADDWDEVFFFAS